MCRGFHRSRVASTTHRIFNSRGGIANAQALARIDILNA
jgi:hypothetical protein